MPPPASCHTVTHHLSHTTLSHTIFHTQLCHTPSFIHNFVTHHLSHTTLSHTIFHTQLCHTPSFTHNFVTHHLSHTTLSHTTLSHTTLSHTIFHIQLCHVTPRHFAWHAWHKLTSTVVLRRRRGTNSHLASFCVAGVGQTHIYHLSHTTLSHTIFHLSHLPSFCVASVAQTHICGTLRGRCGTNSHLPSFCLAGVAQTHIYHGFAWQAWHKLTSTIVLRGRCGTDGSGWRAWSDLVARDAAALCVAGVAQTHDVTLLKKDESLISPNKNL